MLAAWTLASPPSGTPGATNGGLFGDSAGNIGIKTSTPATTLDVNGTTTIRKSLDMTSNRIINVATPTSSLDAVNKAYVDTQIASVSSSTMKVWGQGRTGTAIINDAGECTRLISGKTVKISRSTRPTTWDNAAAACPAGWWVCSASDRGTAACGSGNRTYVECNQRQNPTPTYLDDIATWATTSGMPWGWVSNAGATTNTAFGGMVTTAGVLQETYICDMMPVWCCSH
jgi:hypothetical protein